MICLGEDKTYREPRKLDSVGNAAPPGSVPAPMSTKEATTPEIREAADGQAAALRARGVECTAEEMIAASMLSNLIETTITLNQAMATKGTRKLASPTSDGLVLCLTLVRVLPLIREAGTVEEQAAALNQGLTPVIAELTKGKARDLSKLFDR